MVTLIWPCCGSATHSIHGTLRIFYFSSNTFYFYSKSPFPSLWLNTIVKHFIEFKHRCVILTGSTSPDLHLCWRTRTLNFIIILCTLLFLVFYITPFRFSFISSYLRQISPTWSLFRGPDGRVEHQHLGCLHWGQQLCMQIDLSQHCMFPESYLAQRFCKGIVWVKSFYFYHFPSNTFPLHLPFYF